MRRLLAILSAVLLPIPASAGLVETPTLEIIWSGTSGTGSGVGTNTLTAQVGDLVTADYFLTASSLNVNTYGASATWTSGLTNAIWSSAIGSSGLFDLPLSPGVVVGSEMRTVAEGSLATSGLPAFDTLLLGQLTFEVVADASLDPFLRPGIDGFLLGDPLQSIFVGDALRIGATVDVAEMPERGVPEPSSALVFGTGLLLVAGAVRRRR